MDCAIDDCRRIGAFDCLDCGFGANLYKHHADTRHWIEWNHWDNGIDCRTGSDDVVAAATTSLGDTHHWSTRYPFKCGARIVLARQQRIGRRGQFGRSKHDVGKQHSMHPFDIDT